MSGYTQGRRDALASVQNKLTARRPRAIEYAGLVGRYVDMERPSTPEEIAADYPQTSGMRCLVAQVADVPQGVVIVTDEGLSSLITYEDQHLWQFIISAEPLR